MDTKCMTSSSSLTPKAPIKTATIISKSAILEQRQDRVCIKLKINKLLCGKKEKSVVKLGEKAVVNGGGKKGTIAGAVALIISTSIGSGILALPQKASPAGGYCMTVLYGVLPPTMALSMETRWEGSNEKALTKAKPAIFGVRLFACGLVGEQILHDFMALQF